MACPRRLTNLPVAALGVATAVLGTAAVTLGNGDMVVEHGFNLALASMADRSGQVKSGADLVISSGEQLHLAGSTLVKPVAIGDRITITSGGHERILHVVKVDQLDSSIVPASSPHPTPLLLVTCRDDSNATGHPVRFLIEASEGLPALSSPTRPRTL
jgi:hypothetical protein